MPRLVKYLGNIYGQWKIYGEIILSTEDIYKNNVVTDKLF